MKYDFTTVIDRRGKDSIAVDGIGTMPGFAPDAPANGDSIPMWIADMFFPTAPSVIRALSERISHPIFGYFLPTKEYYSSIIRWQERQHGAVGLKAEHIGYENGVLGGLISALNVVCSKGSHVLVHSPAYLGFTKSLTANGYNIVLSPMKQDAGGVWRMDFEDMEQKLRDYPIHAAILCSPHNPCGRVWEKWELEAAMELYKKYDVYVVSDEIWADLTLKGYKHIPTQSVSPDARQRTVALYSTVKTFNMPGMIGSYHIIYNPWLRSRVEKESSLSHYNEMNVLSMHALLGAYEEEGYVWLEELREVLTENVDYACRFIKEHFKGVSVFRPQGTYMLFIDCRDWCSENGYSMDQLIKAGTDAGVAWLDGRPFYGDHHIRMNLAMPRSMVEEAMRRLKEHVFSSEHT